MDAQDKLGWIRDDIAQAQKFLEDCERLGIVVDIVGSLSQVDGATVRGLVAMMRPFTGAQGTSALPCHPALREMLSSAVERRLSDLRMRERDLRGE